MHLAIGFKSVKGFDAPEMLYCGNDRGTALEQASNIPNGLARVEIYCFPNCSMRKFADPATPAAATKAAKKAAKKTAEDKAE